MHFIEHISCTFQEATIKASTSSNSKPKPKTTTGSELLPQIDRDPGRKRIEPHKQDEGLRSVGITESGGTHEVKDKIGCGQSQNGESAAELHRIRAGDENRPTRERETKADRRACSREESPLLLPDQELGPKTCGGNRDRNRGGSTIENPHERNELRHEKSWLSKLSHERKQRSGQAQSARTRKLDGGRSAE
jgi:hypothetical protein